MTGARFKPYPAYKDSGIEWLGEIPAHWEARRLKHVVALRNDKREADPDKLYIGMENVQSWTGKLVATELEVEGDGSCFSSDDVLFGKLRPYLAKAVLASEAGQCSSEFLVLEPKAISGRFLLDAVLSPGFIKTVDATTYGAKMPRANWETVGEIRIPVPSINEQQAIADFLDRETAKIDALIEEKERLIELLKEKRTALISHAVTKGLDPNVPMKDSGIEWLGQIPAHWEISRLKVVANLHTGGTPTGLTNDAFDENGIPWVKPDDLLGDHGMRKPEKSLTRKAAIALGIMPPGSVLICGIGTVASSVTLHQRSARISRLTRLCSPRNCCHGLVISSH